MSVFADSSALVKLYADEPGSGDVRALADLVVAATARVEVPAGLWRKNRIGELSTDDARILVGRFEADWFGNPTSDGEFTIVAIGAAVLDEAAVLVARHDLRAYDAVQLACALVARRAEAEIGRFACYDRTLAEAAQREGFELVA